MLWLGLSALYLYAADFGTWPFLTSEMCSFPQYRCFPFFEQYMDKSHLLSSFYRSTYYRGKLRFTIYFLVRLKYNFNGFFLKCCNPVCIKRCFTDGRSLGCLSIGRLLITLGVGILLWWKAFFTYQSSSPRCLTSQSWWALWNKDLPVVKKCVGRW